MAHSGFLFLHDSVLEGYLIPTIYPFLLHCPVCWCIIFIVFSYNLLYFCGICCNFSFSFSDFIRYFFRSLAKSLSIFFFFKSIVFYPLIHLFLLLIFMSFLPLTLDFALFLIPLGVRSEFLFEVFLVSWGEYACIAMNFPLNTTLATSHRFGNGIFTFWFIFRYKNISWLIQWLFSNMLLSLHRFVIFPVFSYSSFLWLGKDVWCGS